MARHRQVHFVVPEPGVDAVADAADARDAWASGAYAASLERLGSGGKAGTSSLLMYLSFEGEPRRVPHGAVPSATFVARMTENTRKCPCFRVFSL